MKKLLLGIILVFCIAAPVASQAQMHHHHRHHHHHHA